MAQATLVELQITEGQRLIDRLVRAGVPVTAAAWLNESESGDWYLYLATPFVSEKGVTKLAYRRVNNVIREMLEEGFGMDPFQKKVVAPHDPITKDIVANRAGRPGGPPTMYRGRRLGDLAVEEAYIYPSTPTPDESIGMQLWECGQMTLKPGVGPTGKCRVVVIDTEKQTRLHDRRYHGTREDSVRLHEGQLEVTWTEGGSLRIVAMERGAADQRRWQWSQTFVRWEEAGCPPREISDVILTAME